MNEENFFEWEALIMWVHHMCCLVLSLYWKSELWVTFSSVTAWRRQRREKGQVHLFCWVFLCLLNWKQKTTWTFELIYKTETFAQTQRINLWLPGGIDGEGIVREFGMDVYTVLYLKWITNGGLLCSTGTLISGMWQPRREGSLGENGYMYMYDWVPLLSTWNYHIVNQLYPNIK